MKTIYLILLSFLPLLAIAQTTDLDGVKIKNKNIIVSDEGQLIVSMEMIIPYTSKISSNRVETITPIIESTDKVQNKMLPSVYIYGRRRLIVQQRSDRIDKNAYKIIRRYNKTNQNVDYVVRIPYSAWMNGAKLNLIVNKCGCGNNLESEQTGLIAMIGDKRKINPFISFITPNVENIKMRADKGSAFLDFPVGQIKIYTDFRNNPSELNKIKSTVDVVKNDKNTTITSMKIIGYASPEGSYALNTRLAHGRAEALKKYVLDQYNFNTNMISVSSVPEDWVGVKNYVESHEIGMKKEVLAIINNESINDDERDFQLRNLNWQIYKQLLELCYPPLRRSDYTVNYNVRSFSVDEAKLIIKSRPQQLSLDEMYRVAQTYPTGSADFNEVFETAVRMFPSDPTANENAAAIELHQGNYERALQYLEKADQNSAATLNNIGVAMMLKGDFEKAQYYFQKAQQAGSNEAIDNMKIISSRLNS